MNLSWCILLTCLLAYCGAEDDCDQNSLSFFYKELDCSPIKENGAECPTSYDCQNYEKRDRSKCHFQGKSYSVGEKLSGLSGGSCIAECVCLHIEEDKPPKFNCANVECPEGFGPRLKEGCHHLYEPDSCCAVNSTCEKDTAGDPPPASCTYGNKTFTAGERHYPENSCKVCFCNEEGPKCQDIHCNSLVHYAHSINDGCIPIYYGEYGCCPIAFKCPDSTDTVLKARSGTGKNTTGTCKHGTLELQPNDMLVHSQDKLECTCRLPPYLTCIQKPVEYNFS